jgi:hypothetical protein
MLRGATFFSSTVLCKEGTCVNKQGSQESPPWVYWSNDFSDGNRWYMISNFIMYLQQQQLEITEYSSWAASAGAGGTVRQDRRSITVQITTPYHSPQAKLGKTPCWTIPQEPMKKNCL